MTTMHDFTNRSTTREQWHAERRAIYPARMPTTCDFWWKRFNTNCSHTRLRLHLHLIERRLLKLKGR